MFFTGNRLKRNFCMALVTVMLVLTCAIVPQADASAANMHILPMYQRATDFPQGDLSRLAQVILRAQCGEDITIAFLGGSITEGRGATNIQDCYVSQVYQWWKNTFPQAKINAVNAGIGGTSSYLGVHRVYEEVLSFQPDLVFTLP